MPDPRFPIGPAPRVAHLMPEQRRPLLAQLARLPTELAVIAPQVDWDSPYRVGGWTRRQVIHHLADSHMNGFVRTKLILTEDLPTLCPYQPETWAAIEPEHLDPQLSLALLTALHGRWTALLANLPPESWGRSGLHPELAQQIGDDWAGNFVALPGGRLTLDSLLSTYVWHGRHHLAHLTLPISD